MKRDYTIQPAATWEQPSQQNLPVEKMILEEDEIYVSPLVLLNEDCLLDRLLFQELEVNSQKVLREICMSLNTLVCKHGFKKVKSFKFTYSPPTTLILMENHLKCIGKYINQLQFCYYEDQYSALSLEILCKNIGNNI